MLRYRIEVSGPALHRVTVHLEATGVPGSQVLVSLPRWAPGWYVLKEYAKEVEEIQAADRRGRPLPVEKVNVNTWRVRKGRVRSFTVSLRVYTFLLSDASSLVDASHASLFPPSIFPWIRGLENEPAELVLEIPEAWKTVSTALPRVGNDPRVRRAESYDHLLDCPIEAGNHEVYRFEAGGRTHELAIVGGPIEKDPALVVSDLGKIVAATKEIFGELPYERYVFLLYLTSRPTGSLEHSASVTFTMKPEVFSDPKLYVKKWLCTAAHEFFHLFNVKRIRPADLVPYDYDREQHSTLMWIHEGLTSYFDDRIVLQAGLMEPKDFLDQAAENVSILLDTPGRRYETLEASSFDAWIKFMRKDENWENRGISFYVKGLLTGMCLDLEIRHRSRNRGTLADAMRSVYEDTKKRGYRGLTKKRFREACERAAGAPLPEIFETYLATTEEMDFDHHLAHAGLRLQEDWKKPERLEGSPKNDGWLGLVTETREGRIYASKVPLDTPALAGGVAPGDELVFLDGRRIESEEHLADRIRFMEPGSEAVLTVSRYGRAVDVPVTLGRRPATKWKIVKSRQSTAAQKKLYRSWLVTPGGKKKPTVHS